MSLATKRDRKFNREAVQREIRHPLQVVRKYIRRYVFLEGAGIAVLFLAAWFWLGVLVDYGSFRLFAFDWVQALRDLSEGIDTPLLGSYSSMAVRAILLVALVLALLALVAYKVVFRWLREFSD